MTELPLPLTGPEVDLRGMPFMPVDLVRLFDSDLFALSSGDEFKAAFTLWGKSFLQVPAGSVPDDDRILAHLTGTGSRWLKLRPMALRGWVKCSDGRLYHPVVAEKAQQAWLGRQAQRARTEAARAARAAKRADSDSGHAPPTTDPVTTSVTENVTGSKGEGEGEGEGQLKKEEKKAPPSPSAPAPKGASAPRGHRLPSDWAPSRADCAFAAEHGMNADEAAAEFRDYWSSLPGSKGIRLDWSATFRNSVRMLAGRRKPAISNAKPSRSWAYDDSDPLFSTSPQEWPN